VTAALGLIPVVTGTVAMLGVDDPLYASIGLPRSALLDSNLRFFAGVWAGLGIALLWVVPSIERQGTLFRVVWGAVFLGGVGRLLSMVSLGAPPAPFIGFTILEIVGAPAFVYWQHRLERSQVKRSDAVPTDPLPTRSSPMRSTLIGVLAIALSDELAAQQRPASSPPAATIGAAAVIVPEYPGSEEYRVLPFPMAQVAIGSHNSYLAPSTTGLAIALGAYALRTPRLSLAGELGVMDNRPASRADALAGTEDRDRVATVGASLGYRAGPADARVGVSRGLNDAAGFLGTARLAFTRPFGPSHGNRGSGRDVRGRAADAAGVRRDRARGEPAPGAHRRRRRATRPRRGAGLSPRRWPAPHRCVALAHVPRVPAVVCDRFRRSGPPER
jgi:hypothetical protein